MNIQYFENDLTGEEYIALRAVVDWEPKTHEQVEVALSRTLYSVVARVDDKAVGMARIIGDGVIYWHVQDVVVHSEYQGHGIGTRMLEMLLEHVRENSISGTRVNIGLMAAKGKECFYNKFGFVTRPDNTFGAGMIFVTDIP